MEVRENVLLAPFTTLKVGGGARYFIEAANDRDVEDACTFARQKNVPFFVLGGGSNVLVGDVGFPGLVIRYIEKGIQMITEDDDTLTVRVASGEVWDDFVADTVAHGVWGIENLSGIPGTVGGAVVGNIGAYGEEVCDTCISVRVFDSKTGTVRDMSRDEMTYAYRYSFLKSHDGRRYVMTHATFVLKKKNSARIEYKDLSLFFEGKEKPSHPRDVRHAVLSIRQKKLPDWRRVPTAGSYFKNPVVTLEKYKEIRKMYPHMPHAYCDEASRQCKISAAWLLDHVCHVHTLSHKGVGVHKTQALVVVHDNNVSAKDIYIFAEKIKKIFYDHTGIVLESEVENVGTF